MDGMPELIFIGPMLLPMHGQAVCTAAILDEIKRQDIRFLSLNTSAAI